MEINGQKDKIHWMKTVEYHQNSKYAFVSIPLSTPFYIFPFLLSIRFGSGALVFSHIFNISPIKGCLEFLLSKLHEEKQNKKSRKNKQKVNSRNRNHHSFFFFWNSNNRGRSWKKYVEMLIVIFPKIVWGLKGLLGNLYRDKRA